MTLRTRTLAMTLALAALAAAPAGAVGPRGCAPGEGDARAVKEVPGSGSVVYETRSGYGVSGDRGYLEASLTEEEATVHGRTAVGEQAGQEELDVDGRVLVGEADQDVCVNGQGV